MKGRIGSPNPPGDDGKRKAGISERGGGVDEAMQAMQAKNDGPAKEAGLTTMEEDPLGLIRREIAVMKKLESVMLLICASRY